jgi:periplasmic copper chaperone A
MRYLALGLLLAATSAWSQVEIENPWIRASAPGQKLAAGYITIRNKSAQPDRLVGASSQVAAKVETHVNVRDGDILRMREVKGYDLPANGSFELKPGAAHLMFVDIKRPFKEGEKVPAVLKFEKAGEVKVEFRVAPLASHGPGHAGH